MPVLRVRPRRENRVDVRLWSDVGSQASVEKSLVSTRQAGGLRHKYCEIVLSSGGQ